MTSRKFEVSDLVELRVMQRIMREAKFCAEPDDNEVSTSPIVAQLFKRLIDILIEAEVERDGEEARIRWTRWLHIDSSRDEWRAAMNRAKNDVTWAKMTEEEKQEFCKTLFSPFILSPDLLAEFIRTTEAKRNERNTAVKRDLLEAARAILANEMNPIHGIHQLGKLLFWVVDPKSELLLTIRGLEADMDLLSLESMQTTYGTEAFERLDSEMQSHIIKSRDELLEVCKEIIRTFS